MSYRKPDTTCRRPAKGASKEELRALHKRKMMGKFFRNIEQHDPAAQPAKSKKGAYE
jgi:hypothetical protein